MKKYRLFIWTLCLAAILFAVPTPAQAHCPMWGDTLGPVEIEDISVSYAFYQQLKADEIDVFYFEGRQGQSIHAGIQIPDLAKYKDYSVNLALFGPSLPQPDEAMLPSEHPEDLGALIAPSEVSAGFFEPFTQTNFLGRQSLNTTLPADGQYYILVWHPNDEAGKYVMDVGRKEVFSLIDLFVFPIWWLRVHWYFEHYIAIITIAVLIALVAAILVFRRLRSIHKE